MKRRLFTFALAVLTVGLLGSCSKINERIDGLDKRVYDLENNQIASIEQQIAAINTSINELKAADVTINGKIADLKTAADAQQALIDALQEADRALGQKDDALEARIATLEGQVTTINGQIDALVNADIAINTRIDTLSTYVDTQIGNAKDWATATFASLTEYEKTAEDLAKLSVTVEGISTTLADVQTSIGGLNAKIDGIDSALQDKITTAKTELEGEISDLKTELEGEIADAIAASETSLQGWVNDQLSAYYTAAQMDAKIDGLQNQIDDLKTDTDSKIEELKTKLGQLKEALKEAKTTIKAEYKDAIATAINDYNGTITQTIQSKIDEVNATITALTGRVEALESDVATLKNDVAALKAMIQTVSIIPAYSNGSLKAEDGILTINCVITPKEAVESLKKENFTILTSESEVLTKSALYGTLTIAKDEDLVLDKTNGTATIKVDVSSVLPTEEDKALTVAVNIKNGISDFTTEFVPVTVAAAKPIVEYVEIGGVKWATKNLGAEKVTDSGDYFAWGETAPYYKGTGGWPASPDWKTGKGSGYAWQSYCGSSSFSEWSTPPYDATTKILKPEFDAATQILGEGWRMPTKEEFQALYNACLNGSYDTSTNPSGASASVGKGVYWCTNYDGVAGCLFCDGTNKLFFPAAGYGGGMALRSAGVSGYYWSSSLGTDSPNCAYYLLFDDGSAGTNYRTRYYGKPIRPVKAAAAPLPAGALKGVFSVSATKKVRFSKGNLWYGKVGDAQTATFQFEANQYEFHGYDSTNKTWGLFGWVGASSTTFNSSPEIYGVSTSQTDSDYRNVAGETLKKDWGTAIDDKGTWRTLSTAEWQYLINKNGDENVRKGKYKYGVTVCEKTNCLILAPDGFEGTIATSYNAEDWASAEAAGLVCLPAAGFRKGSVLNYVDSNAYYWSSTDSDRDFAYCVSFSSSNVNPGNSGRCSNGCSVRLVTEVK